MKIKNTIKEYTNLLIYVLGIAFLIQCFVLKSITVDGSSMYPTLHDGDVGYSFIVTRNISINRFDIVILNTKRQTGLDDNLYVKRVIGLPNEKVEYKDNKLYINDVYIEETFFDENYQTYTEDFVVQLGINEYFCMGDNRQASSDSRVLRPFFSKEDILATHAFIFTNNFEGFDFTKIKFK